MESILVDHRLLQLQQIVVHLYYAWELYSLTDDLSYWYLGVALFLSSKLPMVLEQLSIPVTRYVSKALNTMARLWIWQSLLAKLAITPDPGRLAQQQLELYIADQRVFIDKQPLASIA